MRRLVLANPGGAFAMMSTPEYPVRDLKFDAIARLAHEDWNLPTPRTASLEPVLASLKSNVSRVRFLMALPTTIVGSAFRTQRASDIAEFEITGRLGSPDLDDDTKARIEDRRLALLDGYNSELLALQATPAWDRHVLNYHLEGAESLNGLMETPIGHNHFAPLLAAHVTGAWTPIEAMLGDLWEASLNTHPRILAGLRGKANRIGKPETKPTADSQETTNTDPGEKSVPLSLIERRDFVIHKQMGTIFREQRRFEFTRLSSIREAYSRAFSTRSSQIDKALGDPSFDCLSAVRNLLVHKGGIVDAEYSKKSSLPIPMAEVGKPVRLDGEIVAGLVLAAIKSSTSLFVAVDDWLQQN